MTWKKQQQKKTPVGNESLNYQGCHPAKARLNQSLEHLTAEREVTGLIPGGRTNTKGL